MELVQICQRDFVDISFDEEHQWLYVNWKGYQSDASIREGCELMLASLTQLRLSKILNDNREVLGIWTTAAEWLGRDWFPRLRAAGLKKFALVYSPRRLSQVSADTAMQLYDPEASMVRSFHSLESAAIWLAMTDLLPGAHCPKP